MVLRLDDSTLATLVRALRDVPPKKRQYHLRKLTAKADPSRQLRRYYRKKLGRMSLHLEIDPEGVADCLRSVGLSATRPLPSAVVGLRGWRGRSIRYSRSSGKGRQLGAPSPKPTHSTFQIGGRTIDVAA